MASPAAKAALDSLLERLLSRHRSRQIFVFGPTGDPFWAARTPIASSELDALDHALKLIQALEADRPKPFFAHDGPRNMLVGAIDVAEDLYFVVLHDALDPAAAVSRATAVRRDLAANADLLREDIGRRAAAGVTTRPR